ncbi:hypothetical protein N8T08_006089 [Aspergillus melleus]|uniref:Uncharacterized protein n=1 Tax=Aspergillus melleus TaxID=138277 RepID=A0ACC3B0U9_9EURO|nr:hypothetical protein N8T08_006089 [Aspergillus melleus]
MVLRPVTSPFTPEFDTLVHEQLQKWQVPGLTVAIVHGSSTYSKTWKPLSLFKDCCARSERTVSPWELAGVWDHGGIGSGEEVGVRQDGECSGCECVERELYLYLIERLVGSSGPSESPSESPSHSQSQLRSVYVTIKHKR